MNNHTRDRAARLRIFVTSVSLCVGAFVLAACSDAPTEPSPPAAAVSAPLTNAEEISGFKHMAARSRFAIGKAPAMRSELGLEKLVGSDGVISTRPRTGLLVAMPNATAPSRRKPPMANAEAQNAAVRAYFIAAGLPADQILAVETHATMSTKGEGPSERMEAGELDCYYSVVTRQVKGVKVLDSFAWARMSADGEVVSESVYWPALPASVAADAASFRAKLAERTAKAALVARISKKVDAPEEGTLFVRHTPGEWDGAFAAAASYDVGHGNRTIHIREDGAELELPHEIAPVVRPMVPRTRMP